MTRVYFPRNRHRKPPQSKSGLRGVIFYPWLQRKPWKAYIRKHGEETCIGYFATKMEAARAYNRQALRIHGPDTYFNPIPC